MIQHNQTLFDGIIIQPAPQNNQPAKDLPPKQ
jgi:hypothetical protein